VAVYICIALFGGIDMKHLKVLDMENTVFIVLVIATILSYELFENLYAGFHVIWLFVVLIAFFKAMLVVRYFMEANLAPGNFSYLIQSWCVAIAIMIVIGQSRAVGVL
jgi:heme/copper-type cytochrome/quinol oxidase subunit 4